MNSVEASMDVMNLCNQRLSLIMQFILFREVAWIALSFVLLLLISRALRKGLHGIPFTCFAIATFLDLSTSIYGLYEIIKPRSREGSIESGLYSSIFQIFLEVLSKVIFVIGAGILYGRWNASRHQGSLNGDMEVE